MILTNFEIGQRIVADDQKDKRKAEYAGQVLQQLSKRLTEAFGGDTAYLILKFSELLPILCRADFRNTVSEI